MDLEKLCVSVLEKNWYDGFTIPSPKLYPFQWNWDSGFIALGYLRYNTEHAFQELESLFKGQWKNGFLPHIIFHHAERYGEDYFPSASYWNSNVSDLAPANLKTSGITQPPVIGFVLEQFYRKLGKSDRLLTLIKDTIRFHDSLYEHRDLTNSGLIETWHNWESGMDNSPWWDQALDSINEDMVADIQLNRKDAKVVEQSNETRPSDLEYKRYLWLLKTLQHHKFASIPIDYPFRFYDLAINSALIASTESLISLGKAFDLETEKLEMQLTNSKHAFNEYLWNADDRAYYPFDIVRNAQVKMKGAASFLPLMAGVPDASQAEQLMETAAQFDNYNGIPSIDPELDIFEPKRYWRGPVWINMNYLIWKGLLRYGNNRMADELRYKTIELVREAGCREYFSIDQNKKEGYGGKDFSWTAALILVMLDNN